MGNANPLSVFTPPKPKRPDPPPAPPPAPTEVDPNVRESRVRQRKQAALAGGRRSTILTDALGQSNPGALSGSVTRKTLLGQ